MRASELEGLRRDLERIVGMRHVSQADAMRRAYGRDLWPRAQLWHRAGEARFVPDAIVWPGTADEVARIVRYARERHVPITPFGAGSGTVGGAMAVRAGITLDMKRLRKVLSIEPGARRATAQAGIVGQRLEERLQAAQVTLGHFPDSIGSSTLGGWIATRSAGQFSSRFGKIEDMVLGLTAVTGTGEVLHVGPERAPGPDLLQLLCGSEGTLAILTDATLAIHPRPAARALRAFRFKSLTTGLEGMRAILRAGLRPQLLRLVDPFDSLRGTGADDARDEAATGPVSSFMATIRQRSLGVALQTPGVLNRAAEALRPQAALLLVAFEDDQRAQCEGLLREAANLARSLGAQELGDGPVTRWYERRHSAAFRRSGIFAGHGWVDTLTFATTWGKVERLYDAVRTALRGEAFVAGQFPHAYLEGCSIEFTLFGPAPTVERGEASLDHALRAATRAAIDAGATSSHDHGIGLARARQLPDELGDTGMRMLRSLKATFDPDGILNPGKLLG